MVVRSQKYPNQRVVATMSEKNDDTEEERCRDKTLVGNREACQEPPWMVQSELQI